MQVKLFSLNTLVYFVKYSPMMNISFKYDIIFCFNVSLEENIMHYTSD